MATISWRARALKAALRSALKESGMSARKVAEKLDVHHSKVNRWLADDGPAPNVEDTTSFLVCINVTGDEKERVMSIARAADTNWMVAGPPGVDPQLASVLECERYASRIFEFQLVWWPGLLQSGDYARALMAQDGTIKPDEVEARVMIRNARRDVLTRVSKPVRFDAVVGLPAIHGRFVSDEVRATQLGHVQSLCELDNVTVRAADIGTQRTPGGPFIIYWSDNMPTTVYLEHTQSSVFIVKPDVVRIYTDLAEQLRREAMSPEDTSRLIANAIPTKEKRRQNDGTSH